MVTAKDLIKKYEADFSKLSITSSVQIPELIIQVLDLVPQVVQDVQKVSDMVPNQQRILIVDILNIGLKAAYKALGTKLTLTENEWVTQIEAYLTPLIDREVKNVLISQSGKLVLNQKSGIVRLWNWMRSHCCC